MYYEYKNLPEIPFVISEEEKKEYISIKTEDDFYEHINYEMIKLEKIINQKKLKHKILVAGGMVAFDENIIHFLNAQNYHLKDNLVLLSEVTAQYRRITAMLSDIPYIFTPHLLSKDIVIPSFKVKPNSQARMALKQNKYVREAAKHYLMRHQNVTVEYANSLMGIAYCYFSKLLYVMKPKQIILWNAFYPLHRMLEKMCREKDITVTYMEYGCIPGTLCFDQLGQQGKSVPAINRKFQSLHISVSDRNKAEEIYIWLKKSGLNRNRQPDKFWYRPLIVESPIVLYIGQNDYESGIYPYNRESRKYYSPIFRSTLEGVQYLQLLSIKNNWKLLFKPHPLMEAWGHKIPHEILQQTSTVTDINLNNLIDQIDVVVTIFSQCSYIALIRGKPVIMLGYNELKNSGCIYEAYRKRNIEPTIKMALQLGLSKEQKENFIMHLAKLLRYYLYDDMNEREIRFGKQYIGDIK